MSRVMCIWFPNWPIQRWQSTHPQNVDQQQAFRSSAIALFAAHHQRGLVITACSAAAAQRGVTVGMPAAEARSLLAPAPQHASLPSSSAALHIVPHDRTADARALHRLAETCQKYSPIVGFEEADHPESLLLDITGCAHLFGGEPGIVGQVVSDLHQRGLVAQIAIADTVGTAWAMAHFQNHSRTSSAGSRRSSRSASRRANRTGSPAQSTASRPKNRSQARSQSTRPLTLAAIVPSDQTAPTLDRLPVAALRLSPKIITRLDELGVHSIAQLRRLPRAQLPARFGPQLHQRIDQALGSVPELITPETFEQVISADCEFEVPTDHAELIRNQLDELLGNVAAQARRAECGILQLQVDLYRENSAPIRFPVSLSRASQDPQHLSGLLDISWERLQLSDRVERIQITVTRQAALERRQRHLFAQELDRAEIQHQLAGLLDRLTQRLGPQAVTHPQWQEDQDPQHAVKLSPVVDRPHASQSSTTPAAQQPRTPRPVLLAPQPIPLRVTTDQAIPPSVHQVYWQKRWLRVNRQWGPERIESGWWTAQPLRRDYYRIETETGQHFWIYQHLDTKHWFWHGAFD